MFADVNVCEFVISKVFALLKFAILGLLKVNFVFPTNSVLLLLFYLDILDDYLLLLTHMYSLQVSKLTYRTSCQSLHV